MKTALISVADRTNLEQLAQCLSKNGYTILTTTGTKKFLDEIGIKSLPVEEYTGQPEILDGRVKTLHPKIHGGILADRSKPTHLEQLVKHDIPEINLVAVNLYPFQKSLADTTKTKQQMIELIDVGGPTMIRAAAKNFKHVIPLIDPADYQLVIESINQKKDITIEQRSELARKVFTYTAQYDLDIARFMSTFNGDWNAEELHPVEGVVLEKIQDLRYGENPHQEAGFYKRAFSNDQPWKQLNGKELSYNNLLDLDAGLQILRTLPKEKVGAVIIKHLNPCGVALDVDLISAVRKAKRCDPRSHFGGIIALNREVDAVVAKEIRDDFCEIVVAPGYAKDALEILKGSKNLRVIHSTSQTPRLQEVRYVEGGILIQKTDTQISAINAAQVVSKTKPTTDILQELEFAWTVCANVKSNAIVIAKDRMVVGVGAGQMSRIDSVELAISKARTHDHNLSSSVAASDAFFPFPDSIEALAKVGVKAIIAPSGAKKDQESIDTADKYGLILLFTGDRHFKH